MKKTIYEFNTGDTSHHILWSLERVPVEDAPRKPARFCLKIHIQELDSEAGVYCGEELPTYQQANPSVTTLPPSYELSLIRQPERAVVS